MGLLMIRDMLFGLQYSVGFLLVQQHIEENKKLKEENMKLKQAIAILRNKNAEKEKT